jgi:hypothetical protein
LSSCFWKKKVPLHLNSHQLKLAAAIYNVNKMICQQ